ncbi:MAG: polysaccharide biosynthesis tyrosine autokinase [Cyanobacteria bacterium P01_A01_bin.17]
MNTVSSSAIDEPEFGYGQLLNVLLRRFVWVGGSVVGALAIAVFLTMREEPVYQGSMQLLVEPNYRQTTITGEQVGKSSQADYATQLNLMRSSTFVERTVEQLMIEHPGLCPGSMTKQACVSRFQKALSLSQVSEGDTETGIFKATFNNSNAQGVQVFLETLGEVYLEYNQQQQKQRLTEGLALVDQQIDNVQGNLNNSREELKQFRESENLIDPQEQALAAAEALRRVEQTKIEVETQILDVSAEYDALRAQLTADPQAALISARLSQSRRYQQLLNELQASELALEARLALYAEADPGVQDLRSQRQGRLQLLREEVARVLGNVPTQLNLDESTLLTEGQFGETDLRLINDLMQAQVRLESLRARDLGLDQALAQLRFELNEFPDLIAQYESIQPKTEIQQQSLRRLLQLRQDLSNELAQGGFKWNIVEAPQLGNKISPQPKQNLLLGAIAGLFIGGALAFAREALDSVVRTSDDLKKQTPLPLLGVIPTMPVGQQNLLPALSADRTFKPEMSEWQPFRDAIDLLYKNIQLTCEQPLSSLMVTSAQEGEGKSTLSIGLALSAVRANKRVLLIDANLRRPSIHKYFNISNEQGLSTQLTTTLNESNQINVYPLSIELAGSSIDVLTAGPVPHDPVQLLNSIKMQQLLSVAESSYDLVIVDTPAILGLADGLHLASLCKTSIIVSRLDKITQADLNRALSILEQVNAIGIVANGRHDNSRSDQPPYIQKQEKVQIKSSAYASNGLNNGVGNGNGKERVSDSHSFNSLRSKPGSLYRYLFSRLSHKMLASYIPKEYPPP